MIYFNLLINNHIPSGFSLNVPNIKIRQCLWMFNELLSEYFAQDAPWIQWLIEESFYSMYSEWLQFKDLASQFLVLNLLHSMLECKMNNIVKFFGVSLQSRNSRYNVFFCYLSCNSFICRKTWSNDSEIKPYLIQGRAETTHNDFFKTNTLLHFN